MAACMAKYAPFGLSGILFSKFQNGPNDPNEKKKKKKKKYYDKEPGDFLRFFRKGIYSPFKVDPFTERMQTNLPPLKVHTLSV